VRQVWLIRRRRGWGNGGKWSRPGVALRISPQAAARLAVFGLAFAAAFGFGYLRQVPSPTALAAGPQVPAAGDPRLALFHAAADVEARLGPGGGGFAFTATQIQLLRPYPNGPALLVGPDRTNPGAAPQKVDQFVLGTMSGRGAAGDAEFFAEWFQGAGPDGSAAFAGNPTYRGLVHEGELWRRDEKTDDRGKGWIASSDIPGFGVDPRSLGELPELLRRLDSATALGTDADGQHWSGLIDPIWYPGAVAVDGAPFTGAPIKIELWLDSNDRLVALFAVAQNLNERVHQLLCIDRVRFTYPTSIVVPDAPTSSDTGQP
jgi:hypothetical protein